MELRVLKYFLAVAREESITGAAQTLHLSQPTLSRQLKELEEELGKQLMIREPRRILLTEAGMILRKRAEEILSLVEKTEQEITIDLGNLSGDVYLGAGETKGVHYLTQAAARVKQKHPDIRFHISSGDTINVIEQLDQGLIDFGLLFGPVDHTKYHVLTLPVQDIWGVLMRKDSPLCRKDSITAADLEDLPLLISRQSKDSDAFSAWFQKPMSGLHITATYSLAYNASLMVEDGMGYALCLDGIINTSGDSPLAFRPLSPALKAGMSVLWKKYQIFTKASECYLHALQQCVLEGLSGGLE